MFERVKTTDYEYIVTYLLDSISGKISHNVFSDVSGKPLSLVRVYGVERNIETNMIRNRDMRSLAEIRSAIDASERADREAPRIICKELDSNLGNANKKMIEQKQTKLVF